MSRKTDFMKDLFRRSGMLIFAVTLALLFIVFSPLLDANKEAKGARVYGGVFSYSLPEAPTSLFPLETNILSDLRIISQLFDPLVKQQGAKGTIRNYLAERIKVSNGGRRIQIQLKKGVLFNDDPCFSGKSRELTAEDVAFTLSFACSNNPLNQSESILKGKIVGSDRFYKDGINPKDNYLSGIRIINDHLIEINLTKPYNHFLPLLTHPSLGIMSKVAWAYYGKTLNMHPVGSGPFFIKSTSNSMLVLTKNKEYWQVDRFGNQLPYLDEVRIYKNTLFSNEYPLFSREKIDLLFDIPVNELGKAFGTLTDAKKGKNLLHKVHIQKASKMNYLSWNMNKPPFNQPLVRKAFSLALDKDFICTEILRGDGQPIKKGFIPKTWYYSNEKLPVIEQDIAQAKRCFLEAGYSSQNPFPKLLLYINAQKGSNADLWCTEVCRQLKNVLGVEVKVKYVSTSERDEKIKSGAALFWKAGWVGDYPDAESYLRLFYAPSPENTFGIDFHNSEFDQLYLKSLLTTLSSEKRRFQEACESIVFNESAIVPVYTEDFFVMINLRVRGFEMNPSGIIDFSNIYLKDVAR